MSHNTEHFPVEAEEDEYSPRHASMTLQECLGALPLELQALQELGATSDRESHFENHLKIAQMDKVLTNLYHLDHLISEEDALFHGKTLPERVQYHVMPRSAIGQDPDKQNVLLKSLLFTLPHQLERLQKLMQADHLSTLDPATVHTLLDAVNKHKFEEMHTDCSRVLDMYSATLVPLAVAKFKSGRQRLLRRESSLKAEKEALQKTRA
mmetsp:Transcript_60198/g.130734  ORF Transcript_60198/g.130734 Transcript_60198/m.130734 type:complete len:209 (+) Transcript_60198:1-627(+)